MLHFWKLTVCVLLLSTSSGATTPPPTSRHAEIGITGGYPIGVGLAIGYWGSPEIPLVARFSTGVGTTVDIGYAFTREEDEIQAYIGASASFLGYLGVLPRTQFFVGPSVGMRWKWLCVGLGPAIRFENGRDPHLVASGHVAFSNLF